MYSEFATYERMLTSSELRDILGCSTSAIEVAVHKKQLKVRSKIQGKRVFAVEDILEWLTTRRPAKGVKCSLDGITRETFFEKCRQHGLDI